MLPCYAVPYSGSPPTDLHHPPCPPYQHPFHQVQSGPWPSDFGRSTSALHLNSNQRSRAPLPNCVDLTILSDSTDRRSSELNPSSPVQREPSSRPHDPLLFPTLLPRHRIAFHDTSGKAQLLSQSQSTAPWAETRCLCRPSEGHNGGCTPGLFDPPKHSRLLSASLVAQTCCCATPAI